MTVYGSGTYMKWRGHTVVVTAAHLFAFSSPKTLDSEAVIVTPSEKVFGKLVYVDEYVDIAVFAVPKLQSRKAATFNRAQSFEIGDPVVYSGFPGPNNLLTFDGSITGAGHTTDIVIQSFAWPGSSGSGVYNSKGELVGIVVSIMVGGGPSGSQLLGSLVYVAPANLIDSAYLFQNLQKLKRTRNAGF
jgi:S1-C subfamily serine protease